jgi:hypothetical protein
MTPAATEEGLNSDRAGQTHDVAVNYPTERKKMDDRAALGSEGELAKKPASQRRTPRVSLIVVLPENHVVSPHRLARGLQAHGDREIDVVVACAGQPTNLSALQRSVGNAQFILAPAGTSTEDLRELAMRQVPGDIVTLVSGALLPEAGADGELFMTS